MHIHRFIMCGALSLIAACQTTATGPELDAADSAPPKRMVLIGRGLGFHGPHFFPEAPGKAYEPSRYLKVLAPLKEHFTVFSGVSHAGYNGHGSSIGRSHVLKSQSG